jgi:hypothetical protein
VRIGVLVAVALAAALAAPVTAAAAPNVVSEPSVYEFRPVPVDHGWGNVTLRFRNVGDAAAELGSVTTVGAPTVAFSANWDSCYRMTLAPGASCSVPVRFQPPTTGVFHATLSLTSNAPGSPHNVSLSGTGVRSTATVLTATPAFVDFGTLVAGQARPAREIVLQNMGEVATLPLEPRFRNGIGIHSPGESFALDAGNCAGAVLAPGAGCRLAVTAIGRDPHVHRATIEVVIRDLAVAKVLVRAEVVEPPAPAKGTLARRLKSAARAWSRIPRARLATQGFPIKGVRQPLAGRARLALHALAGAQRRPVLIASGRSSLTAGTPRTLTGRSTKRGRRLLRSGAALRLRATLSFSRADGVPVAVRRSFRLVP